MTPTCPNLLVVLTDQQSATMMSCTGNPYVRTPNMDWIAAQGVRFEQAYCTNPVCCPSRFSLMTGRYPSLIGQRHNDEVEEPEKAPAYYADGLGHLLAAAGYETVYAGKQHLPCGTVENLGFHVLSEDECLPMAEVCSRYLQQDHNKPFAMVASFINPHDICYMAIRDALNTPYETGNMRRLIHAMRREVNYLDAALQLPEGMDREEFFATCCPPLPENHQPQTNEPDGVGELLDERPFRRHAREQYTEEQWRMHRWAYAMLTERVDREIGLLLDALRETGRAEDTVVVFTSDHGDLDGAHKLEHKTLPYREATRVPMLLRPPGGIRGAVDETHLICNGLDLLPTLCDYAGAAIPEDLQGHSLRAFAEGGKPKAWRESLLIESQNSLSVVTGEWQYTRFDQGDHREQLYNFSQDPGQTRNFAADPDCRMILAQHRALLPEATFCGQL